MMMMMMMMMMMAGGAGAAGECMVDGWGSDVLGVLSAPQQQEQRAVYVLQLCEFLAFFQQQSIKFGGSLAQQSPEGIADVMGGLRFAIPELLNEQSFCRS